MKTQLNVAGLDPSLRNFGVVLGTINADCLDELIITGMKVLHTKNEPHKFKNVSDLNSLPDLINDLWDLVSDVHVIFVELPIGSQTSRAMYSYGVCIALVALLQSQGKLVIVTRENQRKALLGVDKVTKQDMIDWVNDTYPNNPHFNSLKNAEREHAADALASVHVGITKHLIEQLIKDQIS